jgi:hypothetical protein
MDPDLGLEEEVEDETRAVEGTKEGVKVKEAEKGEKEEKAEKAKVREDALQELQMDR